MSKTLFGKTLFEPNKRMFHVQKHHDFTRKGCETSCSTGHVKVPASRIQPAVPVALLGVKQPKQCFKKSSILSPNPSGITGEKLPASRPSSSSRPVAMLRINMPRSQMFTATNQSLDVSCVMTSGKRNGSMRILV